MSEATPLHSESDSTRIIRRLEEKEKERSRIRWDHWGVILAGATILLTLGGFCLKLFVLTPYILDNQQKGLDAHGASIQKLQQDGATRDERLIRLEDNMGHINESLKEIKGLLERQERRKDTGLNWTNNGILVVPNQPLGFEAFRGN